MSQRRCFASVQIFWATSFLQSTASNYFSGIYVKHFTKRNNSKYDPNVIVRKKFVQKCYWCWYGILQLYWTIYCNHFVYLIQPNLHHHYYLQKSIRLDENQNHIHLIFQFYMWKSKKIKVWKEVDFFRAVDISEKGIPLSRNLMKYEYRAALEGRNNSYKSWCPKIIS